MSPKKSSAVKKSTEPQKKPEPMPKKIQEEEEEEDEDEDLDLSGEDEEEEIEEDLDEIKDDMLSNEEEEEGLRTADQVEMMLRETECTPCSGSSSKLKCKIRNQYGCPPDKKDK
jgi:hypothetical protein